MYQPLDDSCVALGNGKLLLPNQNVMQKRQTKVQMPKMYVDILIRHFLIR